MTDALQKLAALDKAASLGPWEFGPRSLRFWCVLAGETVLLTGERAWTNAEHDAQLAALSHLLLPAFQAIAENQYLYTDGAEKMPTKEWDRRMEYNTQQLQAVLAQLEEALK